MKFWINLTLNLFLIFPHWNIEVVSTLKKAISKYGLFVDTYFALTTAVPRFRSCRTKKVQQ